MSKNEFLKFIVDTMETKSNCNIKCIFDFFGGEAEYITDIMNIVIYDDTLEFDSDLTDKSEAIIRINLSDIVSIDKSDNEFKLSYKNKENIYVYIM